MSYPVREIQTVLILTCLHHSLQDLSSCAEYLPILFSHSPQFSASFPKYRQDVLFQARDPLVYVCLAWAHLVVEIQTILETSVYPSNLVVFYVQGRDQTIGIYPTSCLQVGDFRDHTHIHLCKTKKATFKYCKHRQVRKNFILVKSVERHICDVINSWLQHNLPTSIHDRAISPFREDFIFRKLHIPNKKKQISYYIYYCH